MDNIGGQWEIITLYNTVINLNERGPYKTIGTFTDKTAAKEFGKGKGWYGSDGAVEKVNAVRLHFLKSTDSVVFALGSELDVDMHEKIRRENRRQEILAGLSKEDIDILGLK